jgi:4-hydroxybenzoate polyprenyltransferase
MADRPLSLPRAMWKALRPHQWVKNILVFGGLAFTGRWHEATGGTAMARPVSWHALGHACAAFAIFSLLSSGGYLVNDLRDREADRQHPTKCRRPIASGALPVSLARLAAALLFVVGLGWSWALSQRGGGTRGFLTTAVAYVLLTNGYSFGLKKFVIVDVLCIAVLFVLRAVAGCWVIPEQPSPWIVVCTFFGALFIALCKRRGELVAMGDAGDTRSVLAKYHTSEAHAALLLDQMIQVAATATILTYSLYTFFRPTEIGMKQEQSGLMLTIPFVVYGVLRYIYLVHKRDIGEKPERLFADQGMLINLAAWAITVVYVTRGRNL